MQGGVPEQYYHELMPTTNYYRTEEEKKQEEIDVDKLNEDQKYDLFKEELKKMGVSNTWKWEDAYRVIQDSKYYNVLPSIRQKKQAFNEYIREYTEKLNQSKRENRKRQVQEFYEMLTSFHEINSLSKYGDCIKLFQSDRRFVLLEEKDREEYFQDYLDELEKTENRRKQEHSKRKILSLKNVFQYNHVPTTMKFEEAKEKFHSNPIFSAADKLDQLKAFIEYINEKREGEQTQKAKQKYRKERKNRDAYKQLMQEMVAQGKLTHRTHWKELVPEIKDDPRYHNVLLQSGSTPTEIFYDFQNQEKDKFNVHKVKFKTLLKTKAIKLGADVTRENFESTLNDYEEYRSFPEEIKGHLYEYYIDKVKPKPEKDDRKRDKKHKKKHRRSRSRSGGRHRRRSDRSRERRRDYEEGEYMDHK